MTVHSPLVSRRVHRNSRRPMIRGRRRGRVDARGCGRAGPTIPGQRHRVDARGCGRAGRQSGDDAAGPTTRGLVAPADDPPAGHNRPLDIAASSSVAPGPYMALNPHSPLAATRLWTYDPRERRRDCGSRAPRSHERLDHESWQPIRSCQDVAHSSPAYIAGRVHQIGHRNDSDFRIGSDVPGELWRSATRLCS